MASFCILSGYFIIAVLATGIGSLTGMGGGIILKPVLDLLGNYNVETIGVLSSLAVFSMSAVSIGRHMLVKTEIPYKTAVPLAVGAVAGGLAGQWALEALVALSGAGGVITAIQNGVLVLLVAGVFLYMVNKKRIKGHRLSGVPVSLLAGLMMGVLSSFLGIGGGPVNVAVILYLYSYSAKTAAVCSLITIVFAQAAKLAGVAFTSGLGVFDLEMAPVMVAGAVLGGFIGTETAKRCREETVEKAFSGVQLLVLLIAVVNIIRNIA